MKYLILFILLVFSFSLHAKLFVNETDVANKNLNATIYGSLEVCPGKCHEVPSDFNMNYADLNSIYKVEAVETCLNEVDCNAKFELKTCAIGTKNKNLPELYIYCSVEEKELVVNQTLKTNYLNAQAAKALSDSYLNHAMNAINEGKKVIAMLAVRNVPKNLTTAQIAQINSIYAEIKTLLETGSLVTAKEKISEVTPDGTLVTEADKIALINELNSYLGL